jgi:beta-galactosidase
MKHTAGLRVLTCLVTLLVLASHTNAQQPVHSFSLGDSAFLLDGKPLQMISGEMHCNRIPKEYWRDRIRKAKAMGLNAIGTYIFWNVHEPQPGIYDFSGNNDVAAFVKIAQEEHMWVVMRPSPYVCAEWEFGGYPWWLLKDSTLKVRSKDPAFLKSYTNYINRLAKELAPLQVTHGGNILMIQIENEYGSYSNDVSYLDINRKIFREAGLDVPLFTCDPVWALPNGVLPGYLPTVNGSSDPDEVKRIVNKYHDGKGPYYVAEWYPGWFDDWGKQHHQTDVKKDAANLDRLLAAGISVNMYMFHGGTTRGFMNGANMNDKEPYSPQTSSYDYDAPLDEAGNPTPKYLAFREVIKKYLPAGTTLPSVPEKVEARSIGNITFTQQASLFSQRVKAVSHDLPRCFEDLNQAYGFVLYSTTVPATAPGVLQLEGMRDFAGVYVNGKLVKVLDRRLKQDTVQLPALPANTRLDILVENNGRINFGKYLTANRKGLTGNVLLSGTVLHNWKMSGFPFNTVRDIRYGKDAVSGQPGLYKGRFALQEVHDLYLDMRGFGKGFVFLNGHHLGKYWEVGPQQTIYVPAGWLKKGENEIVVFDQLHSGHTKIGTLASPILNEVH